MKSANVNKLALACLFVIPSAWGESGLMQVVNTVVDYHQGEYHQAPGASMQCEILGESEIFTEYWFINGLEFSISEPDYPNEYVYGLYDPSLEQFTFSEEYSADVSAGNVIYTSVHSYTWVATWSPAANAYIGNIEESAVLSWNLDARTSVCNKSWTMSAVGTPAFSLDSRFLGSAVAESASVQ